MTATTNTPVVVALVLNSVSHDARVLKAAASISQAGYEVVIVGLRDEKCDEPKTVLENGVTIYRTDLNSLMLSMNILAYLLLLMAALTLILTALSTVFILSTSAAMKYTIGSLISCLLVVSLVGAIYACNSAIRNRRRWLSQFKPSIEGIHESTLKKERDNRTCHRTGDAWIRKSDSLKSTTVRIARPLISLLRHSPGFLYIKWKACLWTYMEKILSLEPDFIHCHDLTTLPIGTAYKKTHPNTRIIFDSHELYEEVANLKPALRAYWKRVARKHTSQVDGFIVVNGSIGDELKRRYQGLPDPVVVYNAVELTGAFPTYDGRLHREADVPRNMKILLYQGGFSPHRGLEKLVEAAALLPDDWVLVMMGWGGLETDLRSIASQTDPEGKKTRFIPPAPQPELRSWTCGASLGVIPYENVCMNHWFCSPNKLWEYPAAGVPILASPFPELSRIVTGEDIGIELPPEATPGDMAAQVRELDDARLAELQANCSTFIQKDNWSVYEKRIVSLYSKLEKAPPADKSSSTVPA